MVQVWTSSLVNRELLKIKQSYLQYLKDELLELRFEQQVIAQLGGEDIGVYQKRFIKAAVYEGRNPKHKYINYNDDNKVREFFKKEDGLNEPKFKTIISLEIPKTEFTRNDEVFSREVESNSQISGPLDLKVNQTNRQEL